MRLGLILCAALLFGELHQAVDASAQSLPPTVDPSVQRDRLLKRDSLPQVQGPAVLQAIDCGTNAPKAGETFTLKGVRLESAVATERVDVKARWQPYLGKEVTLETICQIATDLAADYAKESGKAVSATLPAQYIHGGIVQIAIRQE